MGRTRSSSKQNTSIMRQCKREKPRIKGYSGECSRSPDWWCIVNIGGCGMSISSLFYVNKFNHTAPGAYKKIARAAGTHGNGIWPRDCRRRGSSQRSWIWMWHWWQATREILQLDLKPQYYFFLATSMSSWDQSPPWFCALWALFSHSYSLKRRGGPFLPLCLPRTVYCQTKVQGRWILAITSQRQDATLSGVKSLFDIISTKHIYPRVLNLK